MLRWYFPIVTGLILALSLWSFSDNLIWDIDQPSNRQPKFLVHGFFCLAWMSALFVQSLLVRSRKLALHRQLGWIGFIAAIGVTATTAYVFVTPWKAWDGLPFYLQANRLQLPCFLLLVVMGIVRRRQTDWHRRLMYLATLFVLEPILSRAFDPLNPVLDRWTEQQVDFAWWLFSILLWNGLLLSLFAYDRITIRRIHPATASGAALFYAIWIALLLP